MHTRIVVKIQGKKTAECSFNERLAWASVVNYAESLRHAEEALASAVRINYQAMTGKQFEHKPETIKRAADTSLDLVQRFAKHFFPEILFEIELEQKPAESSSS